MARLETRLQALEARNAPKPMGPTSPPPGCDWLGYPMGAGGESIFPPSKDGLDWLGFPLEVQAGTENTEPSAFIL